MNEGAECQTISPAAKKGSYVLCRYFYIENFVIIIFKYVFIQNGRHTVWKFQDFPVTQILHEINFGESRSPKTAYFSILGALNFVNLVNFSLKKVPNFIAIKIQSL